MAESAPLPPPRLAGCTILQVVPALDAGGVERTAVDVAVAVAQAGGRSLIATSGGRMEAELKGTGVAVVKLPLDRRWPLALIANAARLEEIILREQVDLVHARSRSPAWSALVAARRTGRAFMTTYAGIYNGRSGLKRWFNGVMARGDTVIANSAFTRDHVIGQHHTPTDRIVAIPRGLDLARFDPAAVSPGRVEAARAAFGPAAAPGRTVLLLAGRLTRWKGQLLAVEALAAAVARGGDLGLVLAGDAQGRSAYAAEIDSLAQRLDVADRVAVVGHVADMPAAYLAADFAIAPSLDPEAFGRTAAEPQAMGRPVIAADHGATRETVADGVTGRLVPPGDAQAWSEAFLWAAEASPEEREGLGAAGRARVAALFSVRAMTDATLALYARTLATRRR